MRVLSGIQPSGSLHLGNYFGMMKKMVEYQENSELFCCIANYHAMTSVSDGKALAKGTLEAAANFLALGMDPRITSYNVCYTKLLRERSCLYNCGSAPTAPWG